VIIQDFQGPGIFKKKNPGGFQILLPTLRMITNFKTKITLSTHGQVELKCREIKILNSEVGNGTHMSCESQMAK